MSTDRPLCPACAKGPLTRAPRAKKKACTFCGYVEGNPPRQGPSLFHDLAPKPRPGEKSWAPWLLLGGLALFVLVLLLRLAVLL